MTGRVTKDNGTVGALAVGQDAGRRAYDELTQLGRSEEYIRNWLHGFLSGFMEPPTRCGYERAAVRADVVAPRFELATTQSLTARVVECHAFTCHNGASYSAIGLHVDGMALDYRPGDEAAILPSNTPEVVRDVVRALRLNPQMRTRTPAGMEPIWQVLLERVNLDRATRGLYELMLKCANTDDERNSIATLANAQESRARPLLGLLRRFPRIRPPVSELLQSLDPLVPTIVPIASVCGKANRLELLVPHGHAPRQDAPGPNAPGRYAKGEWLSFAIRPSSRTTEFDPLAPVVFVSDQLGAAVVRAHLTRRELEGHRGRNWILGLDAWDASSPFANEARHWQASGLCRAVDELPMGEGEFEQAFARHEDPLCRWIVDKSVIYLAVTDEGARNCFVDRLRYAIAHRGHLDEAASRARLDSLIQEGRLVLWDHG